MYFGDYRFSQDLDFSVINPAEIQDSLPILIHNACRYATDKLQSLGENINIAAEPYLERLPHPEGQQAFTIKAKMPWHRDFHTTVYTEFSFQEIILLSPNLRKIIHPYGNDLEGQILTYPLEEIVAEKIRALLQFSIKLHERGWGRSRVRDYYDIWRIVTDSQKVLDWPKIPDLIQSKCIHKHVVYNGIDDIFQEKLMINVDNEWEKWLSAVVNDLPQKKK
ncbi:MAG: nucleotidyl transferase AbiEii/AbiGii toxin family protein [Candidatus Paracaedibacteraceae bacterium]|nr:nucleotidyl transferase AbiEii/AbiGii toxin family protein [Candidatus Paracaedibacteraceae bacterium]